MRALHNPSSSGDCLDHLSDSLLRLSLEHWAFPGAEAPPDCALARDFDERSRVLASNCWFVTPVLPSEEDIGERYYTLSPAQLRQLQTDFTRARATAEALRSMYKVDNNVLMVNASWFAAAGALSRAFRIAEADVVAPMAAIAQDITDLVGEASCRTAYTTYLAGSRALGKDFVKAQMLLWSCCVLLTLACVVLSVLYCTLWLLRQEGSLRLTRFPDKVGGARFAGGTPSPTDGEAMSPLGEDADVMTPLNSEWR